MIYILIIFYMFAYPVAIIALLWEILKAIEKVSIEKQENIKSKRVHPTVKNSNYNNFNGKTAYELYKNENGLYEPIKPSRGIELKKEE